MKTFDRYLLKILGRFFTLVTLALLIVFDLFDLLNQLSLVGEGSYHLDKAFLYVLLTSGSKVLALLPVLGLLSVLLAQGQLVDRNEALALEAAGFSRRRQALVILFGLFGLSLFLWGLEEGFLKKVEVKAWQMRTRALAAKKFTPYKEGFWAKSDDLFLRVGRVLDDHLLEEVELFGFEGERLKLYLSAPLGKAQKEEWILWRAKERRLFPQKVEEKTYPKLTLRVPFPPDQVEKFALPLDFLDLKTLWQYQRTLKAGGQNVYRYTLTLWERAVTPLLSLAMGLLALSFTATPLKRKKPVLTRLVGGLFGGLLLYLLREALAHAGRVFNLPVPLVALTPLILILTLAALRLKRA